MSVKRLVPLHAVLRYFDGTDWNPIGAGAITGLLDHIHTYDGLVFSVEATEVPAPGTVDGGSA